MQRIIRLKCPACKAAIESTVTVEERVWLTCPACSKEFVAKVPPPREAVVGADVVKPKPVAKPVVQAVPKPPANPYRNAPSTSFPDPLETPLPLAPITYQVVHKRKPLNLKPYIVGVCSVVGLVLVAILGIFGWQWASNTDWSTFSLVPVSHNRLLDQLAMQMEKRGQETLDALDGKTVDFETLRTRGLELGREFEYMLARAVRLKWAPREERAKFAARVKAIEDKFRPQFIAKQKALRDSNQPPPSNMLTAEQLYELSSSPAMVDGQIMALTAALYLTDGIFDLPAPTNQPEQIYYEEANLVHEYLQVLSNVRRPSQCAGAAGRIDKLSESILQLAIRRSKLPPNSWEVVPREYVKKDAAFMAAQRALIIRIKRDAQPDETLKDAVANFLDARQRILDATTGTSELKLRDLFAENKQKRAASNIHSAGDPFYENVRIERDLVAKPRGELSPTFELPSMTEKNPYAPVADMSSSLLSSGLPPASSQIPPPSSTPSQSFQAPVSPSPPPSNSANVNTPPPGYMPRNPLGGYPGPYGAPEGFGPRQGSMAFERNPSSPAPFEMPKFDSKNSVKITLVNSPKDLAGLAKTLAAKIGCHSYTFGSSGNSATIQMMFTGDLQIIVKEIDFGVVEAIDRQERAIVVRGK